ncbi:MAG: hemolysin family protein [Lachnospiraceae bacterium]|nr:hemolysin family protein [Lachnospiraceae bacterium]
MLSNILTFAGLLFVIALFSAHEAAVVSVNNKIKFSGDAVEKYNERLFKYAENITGILTTIKLVLTALQLTVGAFVLKPFSSYFFAVFSNGLSQRASVFLSYLISFLITVFLTVLLGDAIPKKIGSRYPEKTVSYFMNIVSTLVMLLKPLWASLYAFTKAFSNLMGLDSEESESNITEKEIRFMIDAGEDNGTIEESEKEMINNIFEFDNTSVEDIATHRTNIFAISVNASMNEIKNAIIMQKYSRIPIYEENIDDIIGILYVKDYVKYIFENEHIIEKNFDIRKIIKKPYFVPTSKKTNDLFREMQKKKIHMAIVIDEYGGTLGLVTMEDLLEEIVGNIFDEFDFGEKEDIQILKDNEYIIKGSAPLGEVEDVLDIEFESHDDYDTIGGLLIGLLGRIPEDNEHPCLSSNGYAFKIQKIEEKRIETILVTKAEEEKEE